MNDQVPAQSGSVSPSPLPPEEAKLNKQKERELVEDLPDQTQPAEEWGERLATGKGIATGGQNAPEAQEQPEGGDAVEREPPPCPSPSAGPNKPR